MTGESVQFHDVPIILNIERNFHSTIRLDGAAGERANPGMIDVNSPTTVQCHVRKWFFTE
jgi:hypothetical protein